MRPVRVVRNSDSLDLVNVQTGRTIRVLWPMGFEARLIDGRGAIVDYNGNVVGREGDVLEGIGGGLGLEDRFFICSINDFQYL
jgi:hypothetical protein